MPGPSVLFVPLAAPVRVAPTLLRYGAQNTKKFKCCNQDSGSHELESFQEIYKLNNLKGCRCERREIRKDWTRTPTIIRSQR